MKILSLLISLFTDIKLGSMAVQVVALFPVDLLTQMRILLLGVINDERKTGRIFTLFESENFCSLISNYKILNISYRYIYICYRNRYWKTYIAETGEKLILLGGGRGRGERGVNKQYQLIGDRLSCMSNLCDKDRGFTNNTHAIVISSA